MKLQHKMESKSFVTFLLTAFLVLTSLALVGASVSFTVPSQTFFSDSTNTQPFTISNPSSSAETLTFTIPTGSITDGTNPISITPNATPIAIANGTSSTITLTKGTSSTFKFGTYTSNFAINGTNGSVSSTQNTTLTFIKTLCSNGTFNASSLDFEVDVTNLGEGEDSSWKLLDDVEVEVTLDNNKNVDLSSVYFQLGLVKVNSGTNVAEDLIWSSEDEDKIKVGDIDSEDDTSHIFQFKVPNTLDDGDYLLMVRAYTKDNGVCIDSATGLDGTYLSLAKAITVERESDDSRQIVIDDISFNSDTTTCGGEAIVSAKAYNIGTESQDAIKVYIVNKELGLKLEKLITKFHTSDDPKDLEFVFTVPKNATAKSYILNFYSLYNYDKSDDDNKVYPDSSFDDVSETFTANLIVSGACESARNAQITAQLNTETPKAVIGNQVIIEATIKNTGTSSASYIVSVDGNSAWSTLVQTDPQGSFTLAAGESKLVSLYLDIKSSATEGNKELTIKATSGTATNEQKISLNLEKGFSSQALINHFKNNWIIYAIVLVNLILIIAIILAVRSILRK